MWPAAASCPDGARPVAIAGHKSAQGAWRCRRAGTCAAARCASWALRPAVGLLQEPSLEPVMVSCYLHIVGEHHNATAEANEGSPQRTIHCLPISSYLVECDIVK